MISVFENSQLNLKMQTIATNGQLYFKAKEVARALGYENTRDALARHVPEEYKKRLADIRVVKRDPLRSEEHPHSVYVTEPGLYELVFGSHLPAAKEFKRWVFEEVLPSIRKNGAV